MKYETYRSKPYKSWNKNDDGTEIKILSSKIDHLISLLNIVIRNLGGH